MPTIFRRIRLLRLQADSSDTVRNSHLFSGAARKYLLYALGEFVLIVAGILFALKINNWNEYNKLIKQQKDSLQSIQKEIKENLLVMDSTFEINTNYLNSLDNFINEKSSLNDNQTLYEFRNTINYRPATILTPALNDFLDADHKAPLLNTNLLNSLRELKDSYEWITKSEYYLDEYWNNFVAAFLIQNNLGAVYHNPNQFHTDFSKVEQLRGNETFKSLIFLKRNLQSEWYNQQSISIKKSQRVLQLLKEELGSAD